MQTVPSGVHRFPSAFIKAQVITTPSPELSFILPLFIPHPNSCHTLLEQHHMNTVILVRKHLHPQILYILNYLLHSHVSFLSAAKIQQRTDKLCPPPKSILFFEFYLCVIYQLPDFVLDKVGRI